MQATQGLRDTGLDAVIGMYPTVHRLRTTVVAPWAGYSLGDAAVRPPHRVLVHGPEGCGTTFIANRLVDELAAVAGVAGIVVPNVDDIADRDPAELSTILAAPETRDVVLIGTAHRPWAVPVTMFGEGGFERMAFVSPPDWDARRFRLWETPYGSALDVADLDRLVIATEGWSGVDLAALATSASSVEELLGAIASRTPSTTAWLDRARAMVHALEGYGRVDDLVGYLQRYRLL